MFLFYYYGMSQAKVGGSCAILRITNYEKVICLSQNGDDVSLDGINYIDSCDDEIESFDRFGKWVFKTNKFMISVISLGI